MANYKKSYVALAAIILGSQSYAHAEGVNGVLGFGLDFGGKTLGTLVYDNGDKATIKSHEGMSIYGGADFTLQEDIKLRGTIGYKFDSANASNGDAEFSRIPLEGIVFKTIDKHNFGAGISYHTAGEYSCKVSGVCDFNIDVEDALGWVAQYEYLFTLPNGNVKSFVGARYSSTSYTFKGGGSVDASGGGIQLGMVF